MTSESSSKSSKREPLVLELSSLEKVVEELDIEPIINNKNDRTKIMKDEQVKFFTETFIADEKNLVSDATFSKAYGEYQKIIDACEIEEFSCNSTEPSSKQDGDKQELTDCKAQAMDILDGANVPEKTGLDKLVPYHLFNCINPDILIKINEAEFGVHRPLLKLYTSFFEEAVADMDECIVTLPENKVKMEIFQAIYSWMLHESDDALNFIDRKNIANVFVAAKFLKIQELVATCKTILECKDLFNEMTAFSLLMEAYNVDDTEMQILMLPRIQSVFLHIVSSSLFVNLPIEVVLKLIGSDYIQVHSELEVFYSAIRWLLHDWPTRSYHANRVMNQIRFALLKPSQLIDLKRCPDSPMIKFITNGKDILKLIDDGIALSVKMESYGGSPDMLKEECEKLGLRIPSQRCWFEDSMQHQTYEEFIQSLETIRRQHHYS
ncbi:hypothetical protein O3M35_010192 [Rhynocoris fuscipes]|uniref:BTB domain-containing protein n=1 Tax=Rhynocoris fuscipes TaxID=488301 RepID=A0AAW1CXZ3_9HEMI